jgi:ABC-type transport system involved in multi-copper enzyme maturation permease subunit
MKALLRAELIKLRTTRTFIALSGVAVATSALIAGLTALLSEPTEQSVLFDVFASDTSSLFIMILAIIGITGEWRHRTISGALLAAPDRIRFLLAKTLAFTAAGVLLSVSISVGVAILAYTILEARDLPVPETGEVLGLIGRNALVAALLGALGVGVGAVVRNQVASVVAVLVLGFAIEPALLAFAPEVARFGPVSALPMGLADIPESSLGLDGELLTPWSAALAMLAWVGAAVAAGAVLLRRRDVL